jgi:hypothetical protein
MAFVAKHLAAEISPACDGVDERSRQLKRGNVKLALCCSWKYDLCVCVRVCVCACKTAAQNVYNVSYSIVFVVCISCVGSPGLDCCPQTLLPALPLHSKSLVNMTKFIYIVEPLLSGLMTGCHWPDNNRSRIIEHDAKMTC